MSGRLELIHEEGRHVEVRVAGGPLLWRYVYLPDTPPDEAPRPYAHPVCTLAGDVVTNFRPNDHPWHHGLSLTLTDVNGVNFWGGPSHRTADGYQWRGDQGRQVHGSWLELTPERMRERVEWHARDGGRPLLSEVRVLETRLLDGGWMLRWQSELRNVSGERLLLQNYHSGGGLVGSHYTGLQFRGARELLDDHGDKTIGLTGPDGRSGEAAVHGAPGTWMEWACQHDTTLRRTRIRFESLAGPVHWFVRAKNPLAAFAFHRAEPHPLEVGATLRLDHALTLSPA